MKFKDYLKEDRLKKGSTHKKLADDVYKIMLGGKNDTLVSNAIYKHTEYKIPKNKRRTNIKQPLTSGQSNVKSLHNGFKSAFQRFMMDYFTKYIVSHDY